MNRIFRGLTRIFHQWHEAWASRGVRGRSVVEICGLTLLLLSWNCSAEEFNLPGNGDSVIGSVTTTVVKKGDTLLDIARRNELGYRDIQLANPGVDMWLPGKGRHIVLPTKYVLPLTPHTGIVLNIPEMRLYYYPKPVAGQPRKVITYPLGIGREGWTTPYVNTRVIAKQKHPSWYPPKSIQKEHAEEGDPLPDRIGPGPDNPLGNYALKLALPSYLIHGTNKPYGIGLRVSHGCIRLYPEDIKALFQAVPVGTPVHIVNQPYKLGLSNGRFYLEAHPSLGEDSERFKDNITSVVQMVVKLTDNHDYYIDWNLAQAVIREHKGIPVEIGRLKKTDMIAQSRDTKQADARDHKLDLKLESGLSSN